MQNAFPSFVRLNEEIVQDERADETYSQAEIDQVKIREGQKILSKIPRFLYHRL